VRREEKERGGGRKSEERGERVRREGRREKE
jgi:hypothetical protein